MSQQDIVDTLIEKQGTLFSESMGIDLGQDSAKADFAWLVGSILLAKRISHSLAERAGKALNEAGLMSVDGICEADEDTLIHTLGENGYKRYRELATNYLKETARWVKDDLGGDLRQVRDGGDPGTVLERLHGAKGIGAVGADIFAREAQLKWDEFYPRLEGPAADKAREFGLASDHGPLVSMAGSRERFVRLAAALSRAAVDETDEEVEDALQD